MSIFFGIDSEIMKIRIVAKEGHCVHKVAIPPPQINTRHRADLRPKSRLLADGCTNENARAPVPDLEPVRGAFQRYSKGRAIRFSRTNRF